MGSCRLYDDFVDLNSIAKDIVKGFLYTSTVKELWINSKKVLAKVIGLFFINYRER